MTRLIAVLLLVFALAACGQPYVSQDGDEISALSDSWEAALNAGDLDALAALYTADALLMPPNEPAQRGQEAVRTMFDGMIAAGLTLELTTLDARESGDTGYNVGVYTMRAADGTRIDTGKFAEIWKRSNGSWQIASDIWNSDMPAMKMSGGGKHVMILHEVEDAARWMAAWSGKDSRHKLFMDHGVAHVHAFHSPDKPNLTGLVVNVSDMDAFQAMLESDMGRAAAAEDGVMADTIVMMSEVE